MIFLSPFLDVTSMSVSTVLFPCTGRLWNSVPIECFPLTYDLKCRINRDLFYCRFFLNRFPVCCNLFVLVFLLTPCLVVTVQPCMGWIPIKKKKLKRGLRLASGAYFLHDFCTKVFLFSFSRYQTKCVISSFLGSYDVKKEAKTGNTKIWISRERKELFRWKKKHLIVFEGLSFGEMVDTSFKETVNEIE